jgi:hypothetical protein
MTALKAHARDPARRETHAGAFRYSADGTPRGGALSLPSQGPSAPAKRQWADRGRGVRVRYADDLVVWHSRQGADRMLVALVAIPAELGLGSSKRRRGSCTPKDA